MRKTMWEVVVRGIPRLQDLKIPFDVDVDADADADADVDV